MVLLHNIVDVSDSRRDEKRKDEGDDVVLVDPDVNVDRIKDGQEREAPRDTVNEDTLAAGEKLVDNGAEKQQMNERPACKGYRM